FRNGFFKFKDSKSKLTYINLYTKEGSLLPKLAEIYPITQEETIINIGNQSQEALLSSIAALAEAEDAKDSTTSGHSKRVSYWATDFAKRMDYPFEKVEELRIAALLHDIGKIGVSDEILFKKEKLLKEEKKHIEMHPIIGVKILESIAALDNVIPHIRHHHERYDGEGYPAGLKTDEIPEEARIIAIIDAFDAMSSQRPYRPVLTKEEILDEFDKNKGKQFDPVLTDEFINMIEEESFFEVLEAEKKFLQFSSTKGIDTEEAFFASENSDELSELDSLLVLFTKEFFKRLNKLTGEKVCQNISTDLNRYCLLTGAPFFFIQGELKIIHVEKNTTEEKLQIYKFIFKKKKELVSGAIGERLFRKIVEEVVENQRTKTKQFFQKHLN
ncbi:MAG: HD domain-containing protein, partial [Actinomycetia bacterium]|nr:HD domain-containing protein [Actinomycetes bacterium]